jgi:DNA-directed RNA polymerase specialized sigma24 family protein
LLAWLDEGLDSQGQAYLAMRRRLVSYFERKRCLGADDLADETLNRVTRRLDEQGTITDTQPARYCFITAKFVLLEHLRQVDMRQVSADSRFEPSVDAASPQVDLERESGESRETLLDCLDDCLMRLDADERALILEYYCGEQRAKIERRRQLAARLQMTANALSLRACRIRGRLHGCVKACSAERTRHVSAGFVSRK